MPSLLSSSEDQGPDGQDDQLLLDDELLYSDGSVVLPLQHVAEKARIDNECYASEGSGEEEKSLSL